MYNPDPAQKQWLIDRMESTRNRTLLSDDDRRRILRKLVEAESFEKFLHTKYVGQKRYSLEGGEAAIPLLDRLLDRAAEADLGEAVIGMSHRGRLTVLTNTVGKPVGKVFAEFEGDVDPESIQGSGDVKYHLGASGTHVAPGGARLSVSLAPNPSHLEAVDPVVEGMVRAKQTHLGEDREHRKVLPVLLHGDAAFAGQGVVAETINMSQLHGYRTGGHRARRREQPDRLHDEPGRRAVVALLHRRREDGAGARLPRERRRPRGRRPRRGHRDRLPQHVPARRRDRPRLLSPLRPQRGGRAELHAAPDVPEDQGPRFRRAPLRRVARPRRGISPRPRRTEMWASEKAGLEHAYDEARGTRRRPSSTRSPCPPRRA